MKKTSQLFFALKANKWVHISSVPSGKACACQCPACGADLVAKKGKRNQHHFSHAHGYHCAAALETCLHRLAKAILFYKKSIYTPPLQAYRGKVLRSGLQESFVTAEEEVSLQKVRLDILLRKGTERLAIEIKVTHAAAWPKINRLAQLNLPTVELDMLRIYEQHLLHYPGGDLKQLAQTIIYGTQNRQWLFHPWQHRYEYRLAQTATVRKVQVSKQGDYYHYLVYRCPRNLRFVRSGFREGQAYARVFQDCLHCAQCREISYQQQHVGYRRINTLPCKVYCSEA